MKLFKGTFDYVLDTSVQPLGPCCSQEEKSRPNSSPEQCYVRTLDNEIIMSHESILSRLISCLLVSFKVG